MKRKDVWADGVASEVTPYSDSQDPARKAYLKGLEDCKRRIADRLRSATDLYDGKDFHNVNQLCEELRTIVLRLGEDEVRTGN